MKICPNCQTTHEDSLKFCLQCGTELVDQPNDAQVQPADQQPVNQQQPQYQQQPGYQQPEYQNPYGAPPVNTYAQPYAPADPADHTAEYDAEDIDKNKIFALSVYLFGVIGIIIALLAAKDSGFVKFHVRNALKFWIVSVILYIAAILLCWTFIVPIAAGVCSCIVLVLEIIAFVQACKGQAKEPAIIKNIKFLK